MKTLATENTEGSEIRGRKNALDCHDAAYGQVNKIRISSFPRRRESFQIIALAGQARNDDL